MPTSTRAAAKAAANDIDRNWLSPAHIGCALVIVVVFIIIIFVDYT